MVQPEKCLLKKSQMCPISLKHNIYFENNDKNFYWYGGGIKRAYHKEIVEIPESGDYHLIIWNQQKGPIKIEYDLHILK